MTKPEYKPAEIFENESLRTDEVVFEQPQEIDTCTSLTTVEVEEPKVEPDVAQSRPSWLIRIALTSLVAIIGVELTLGFIDALSASNWLAGLYLLCFSSLLLICVKLSFKEYLLLRRLKHRKHFQLDGAKVVKGEASINVNALCDDISQQLDLSLVDNGIKSFEAAKKPHHSDAEVLALYEHHVVQPLDHQARQIIIKHSTDCAVMVALSPFALVDMMIVLWRNMRMINELSQVYGLNLGYWSRIRLLKQMFRNMAYAGATELISDLGTQMLGAGMTAKLSTRVAQGLSIGVMSSRLGIIAAKECRPIAFSEDAKPSLSSLAKGVMGNVVTKLKLTVTEDKK